MRVNKRILRLGRSLFDHKGKILAGLASLAVAELANLWVRHRMRLAEQHGKAGKEESGKQSETNGKAKGISRSQRREIYQAPMIPKANMIRH